MITELQPIGRGAGNAHAEIKQPKVAKKKHTTFKFEKKSAAALVEINVADRIVQEEKMEHDTACCKKQVAAKCCTPSGGKIISARCGSALFLIFCSRLLLPKSVTPQ